MDIEKTKTQMRKGILEYCILSIIKRGGDAYASDIIDELKKSEMIVVEGTLYPLLTRLKNDNLLTYRWEESTSGPPRKYYTLTDEGVKFLEELAETWRQLQDAVNKVTIETNQHG
jgi:PadR family transcriptional regulator PadR